MNLMTIFRNRRRRRLHVMTAANRATYAPRHLDPTPRPLGERSVHAYAAQHRAGVGVPSWFETVAGTRAHSLTWPEHDAATCVNATCAVHYPDPAR